MRGFLKIIFTLLIIIFCDTKILVAQFLSFPSPEESSWDIRYCGGRVLRHTPKAHLPAPPYSYEVELSYSHRNYGKRAWEARNNFAVPSLNLVSVQYVDPQFGFALALYPGIEYSIIRRKNIKWYGKMGGGIAYASKAWTRQDTMMNYIGSHINEYSALSTGLSLNLSRHCVLELGLRLSHISNGSFRLPNYGINLTTAYLGMQYHPVSSMPTYQKEKKYLQKVPFYVASRAAVSFGESLAPDGPIHSIYNLSIYGGKYIMQKHRYFLGLDGTYNVRDLNRLRYLFYSEKDAKKEAWSSSLFGGIELLYGKIGIPLQIGFYTKKPLYINKNIYQKFGMQWYFYEKEHGLFKKIFASALLKTHTQNADNIEFCFGFMF